MASEGKIANPLWFYGQVTSVTDDKDAGRIKVRKWTGGLFDKDDDTPIGGELPWCEPLLPKYINVIPKVGDIVKIFALDPQNPNVRRYYIGPIIGQQDALGFSNQNFNDVKLKIENSAYNPAWSLNPESYDGLWKIYPDKQDIGFIGRSNTDIILRDPEDSFYNEIILRAGKINPSTLKQQITNNLSPLTLNKVNPGYITINFTQAGSLPSIINPELKRLNLENDRSHINFVATKINLISHEGSAKKGTTPVILQGNDIVTQIDVEKNLLHPVPYADVLWEFMNLMKIFVDSHIHKGSRREPDGDFSKLNLMKWFEDNVGTSIENCKFCSKGVKTN